MDTPTLAIDARAAVLAEIEADRLCEWTPDRVQELTGLHRAPACRLLSDLAAEGHLEGAFQRYRPAPPPGLRQLLGRPDGPRRFNAIDAAASWLKAGGRQWTTFDIHRGLIKATTKPGRPGVHGCVNVRQWFPKHIWPGLLPHVYRGKLNVAGWQLLLSEAWSNLEGGSSVVIEAAGNRETLLSWFRYADYGNVRMPAFRKFVSLNVPADIVLYRGGQGSVEELAKGWSWTTNHAIAATYAVTGVRAGDPVILRRKGNAGALMRRHIGTMEVTIDPLANPGAAEVYTTDAEEITALAKWREDNLARMLALGQSIRAITDDELLAGYCDE